MSIYRIFRVNHYNPELAGKRKRTLFYFHSVMIPAFILVFLLCHFTFSLSFGIIFGVLVPFIFLSYLILHLILRAGNRHLEAIGEIEFTTTGIRKKIGDSSEEFFYENIRTINLKKHFPAVTFFESKSGYFTYTLSILFIGGHTETYVLSDLPEGRFREISITETLTTLKKMLIVEVEE